MKKDCEPTQQFSVRLPLSLLEKLERWAADGNRTRTQQIIRLIQQEDARIEKKPKKTS